MKPRDGNDFANPPCQIRSHRNAAFMKALLSLNVGIGLLCLALGGHWVDWHFRALADVAARTSAFELGSQVHAVSAVAYFAAGMGSHAIFAPLTIGLIGSLTFSGALYAFAIFGWTAVMSATVIGAVLIGLSWIWIALRLQQERSP